MIYILGIIIVSSIISNVLSFQPEFPEPIVNISVIVGRDATFTCHVRHLGGYRVGWVKADTKAIQAIHEHVITHNPRVSVTHSDMNTWNLHIKSVTEEDRGGYMCQLNTDPMKSQIGYLDVVIPPDFIAEDTSSDVIVPEGGIVKLTCRARGYPAPNVTWRREDGSEIVVRNKTERTLVPVYSGEVLILSKLSRSEMGSYLCIASNGVPPSVSKRILLSIHFHPIINVRNQLVGSPFDKDVSLECNVEASPKSINYWVRDTGEMIVSSPKYNVQEFSKSLYETTMIVTIRKFQQEDLGSYRCIAKNSLGEVESSIRLYEIPDPNGHTNSPKYTSTVSVGGGAGSIHSNDVYRVHKHRPKEPLYPQPQDDDDDNQSGSAEDYGDPVDDKTSGKPTKTTIDNNNNIYGTNHFMHNHHSRHGSQSGSNVISAGGIINNVGLFTRKPPTSYSVPDVVRGAASSSTTITTDCTIWKVVSTHTKSIALAVWTILYSDYEVMGGLNGHTIKTIVIQLFSLMLVLGQLIS